MMSVEVGRAVIIAGQVVNLVWEGEMVTIASSVKPVMITYTVMPAMIP